MATRKHFRDKCT